MDTVRIERTSLTQVHRSENQILRQHIATTDVPKRSGGWFGVSVLPLNYAPCYLMEIEADLVLISDSCDLESKSERWTAVKVPFRYPCYPSYPTPSYRNH